MSKYVNVDGVMCLPSPISVTVAIVVITVFTNTTVTAKLGFDSADAQYECCSLPPSSSKPAERTKQKDTVITMPGRQKNVVLEPSTVSSPCGGGVTDVLYEWCMPEDAPASMMFVGDTCHTRTAVVVGIEVDEALFLAQHKWLQPPSTADERERFMQQYEQKELQQLQQGEEKGGRRREETSIEWTFLLKTTCPSTNTTETQSVRLRVKRDESDEEAVEVLINPSLFDRWTTKEKERLEEKLSAALTAATLTPEKTRVVAVLHQVDRLPLDGRWRCVFHVEERDVSDVVVSIVRARDAIGILKARTSAKNEMKIEKIEMRTCQLSCSGNGVCDWSTKRCVCEDGWLPSPLSLLRSGGRTEDCSWSTMTMASFVIVMLASGALLVMATKKHKSRRSLLLSRRAARRRQRYEHLRSDEGGNGGGIRRTSRTRKRSGNGGGPPTLVALPPRSWSSSSLSSDECGDLVPIRRGAP
eukprot:PDM64524.1 hypothetical protein PRIPAC_52780 [Pristionchus pacificus]